MTHLLEADENLNLANLVEALEVAYAAEIATEEIRAALNSWVHSSVVLAGHPSSWAIDAFKGVMGSMAVDIIRMCADAKPRNSDFSPSHVGSTLR